MTGFAFFPPQFTLVNSSGRPYAGAVAQFFRAGTSTGLTVYTDASLATPHGTSVTASSTGVFPPVFVDPEGGDYKVSFFTSAGSLIRTVDNLPATYPLTAAQVGAALYPRTAAEITAAVTPSDYAYPAGDIRRYGASGDGVTDDSAAIQAAIDQAEAGGAAVYIPIGTFLVSSRLTHDSSNGITIQGDGYGSVLKGASGGTAILLLVQHPSYTAINGLRLSNFRVDGNGGGQYDAGIVAVNNAVGFVIDRLWIENGSRVSGSSGVNGISFSYASSGGTGGQGTIRDCVIRNCSKAGINWTSGSVSALISGNTIYGIGGNGTAPGIQINGGFNGKLIGNDISGAEGAGIYLATDSGANPARNAIIAHNTIRSCGASSTTQGDGILVTGTSATGRLVIEGNQIYDNGTSTNGGSGIHVIGHDNVVIASNLCRDNQYDGIRVADCSHVAIHGNRCTANNQAGVSYGCGISLRGTCSHVSVTGNHCSDDQGSPTQDYGIQLTSAAVLTYLTIEGNHLEGNADGALLADAGAKPCRIEMCGIKQTTDGSASTVQYFTLPDDSAAWLRVSAVGKKTDGTDRAIYSREGAFYRDGGSATQQGATTTLGSDIESDGTWTGLTLGASSNTALVQVAGLGATTIDWRAEINLLVA